MKIWLIVVTLFLDSGPYFRYMPDGHLYASKELCINSAGRRELATRYAEIDLALKKAGTSPVTDVDCVSQRVTK